MNVKIIITALIISISINLASYSFAQETDAPTMLSPSLNIDRAQIYDIFFAGFENSIFERLEQFESFLDQDIDDHHEIRSLVALWGIEHSSTPGHTYVAQLMHEFIDITL